MSAPPALSVDAIKGLHKSFLEALSAPRAFSPAGVVVLHPTQFEDLTACADPSHGHVPGLEAGDVADVSWDLPESAPPNRTARRAEEKSQRRRGMGVTRPLPSRWRTK